MPEILLTLAGLVLSAGFPVTLEDDVGRSLELASRPLRIVSTAPANTEVLFALGAAERVVGVTTHCKIPEAASRTRVGDFVNIDMERVLALEPDLIIATWLAQKRWVEALEKRGLRVLVVYPKDLAQVMESIGLIGRAVGQPDEAAELVADMRVRLKRLDGDLARRQRAERPNVFVLLTTKPMFTVGPGSSLDELVRRAGGRNVFGDLAKAYASVNTESVLARNPDVILMAHDVEAGEGLAIASEVAGLGATRAVRNGRVIDSIDPDLLVHPNHRLVDGIEALHRALFPPPPPG